MCRFIERIFLKAVLKEKLWCYTLIPDRKADKLPVDHRTAIRGMTFCAFIA